MNFFVKKDDVIEVKVWAWESDGNLSASADKSDVPKSLTAENVHELKFWFKKPSYSDSKIIAQRSQIMTDEAQVDTTNLLDAVLATLLSDWNLQRDNEKVEVSMAAINDLDPALTRAAVAGALQKIKL